MNNSPDKSNMRAEAWKASEETFAAHAARQHVPLSATFELTARCSLSCRMCYIKLHANQVNQFGRELTADEWIDMGRKAVDSGTMYLLLTGGEPLIRSDFEKIYTEFCQMGLIITLNTNATLMNEQYFKLFSKYPPTAVAVTLYGASPETYEKVCGDASGFEKTLNGLDMFTKIPTNIEIRTTFVKDNANELEELRKISKRYTKRFAINYMVFNSHRGINSDAGACRLSAEESIDLDMKNYKHYAELDESEKEHVDPEIEEYFKNLPKDRDYGLDIPPKIITCLASKCMYWITWDGKMLPCGTFEWPYTLPLEEGFVQAWNRLPTLFEEIKHPKECYECELIEKCPNCPGYMQAETGNFEELSTYLCDLSKERNKHYSQPI